MHPVVAVSRPNCVKVGSTGRRGIAVCASRSLQAARAVASPPALQGIARSPQVQQPVTWQQHRPLQVPSLQRARRPQLPPVQQRQEQQALPAWADRYRRQVRSLPQGQPALHNLLLAVDRLLEKAEHCGNHSSLLKAYLRLGLIDLTSEAWQQRSAQLDAMQLPPQQLKQERLLVTLALSGCRFMRIEAAHQLAKQLHLLMDDEGYCPSLNLSALPAPHALGLPVPQLLRQGLGIDLQNPAMRMGTADAGLSKLSWEEYEVLSSDHSMCGGWQFEYFSGDATWIPAPYGKFSTPQLASVLTADVILASLPNGIWGRALVAAAQEQGLPVTCTQQQERLQQQQQRPAQLASAAAGVPEAVKQLLEESMGLQGRGGSSLQSRVRHFSAAVAAVRAAMLGETGGPSGASVAGN